MSSIKPSFFREFGSYVSEHKALCACTFGVAAVVYGIGNLCGRLIVWVTSSSGTTKQTDGVGRTAIEHLGPTLAAANTEVQLQRSDSALSTTDLERLEESLSVYRSDPNATGNKEDAVHKIRRCFYHKERDLYLSGLGLNQLPSCLSMLTHLQCLHLTMNYLTKIPKELGQLVQLTILNLSSNQLQEVLPVELGLLAKLQDFNLSHNQLTAIPKELGQLVQLTCLNLSSNKLQEVPVELGRLEGLQNFNLSHNLLTAIPKELGQLVQLQALNLSSNKLQEVPVELGRLVQLTTLNLSENQLDNVPGGMLRELVQLKNLNLSKNRLKAVPAELGQLVQLNALYLNHNQLIALPPEIGSCIHLTAFTIQQNKNLRELPLTLGSLPGLTDIDTEGTALNRQVVDALLEQCATVRRAQGLIVLPQRLHTWKTAGNSQVDLSDIERFTDDDKGTLNEWLVRLAKTNDFHGNQQPLARAVCEMLHSMMQNAELKELFLAQMSANNENCQDRAAQAFNELYTSWKVQQLPENVPLQEKLNIMIRGAKTLALRAAIAECIKKQEQETGWEYEESVESYLFYELALKERLNLLSVIQNMNYAGIGKRDWIHEDHLIAAVQKTYIDHLIALPAFTKLLKDNQAFKEMWDPQEHIFGRRIERLDESSQASSPELSEEHFQYIDAMNAVRQDREQKYKEIVSEWLKRAV